MFSNDIIKFVEAESFFKASILCSLRQAVTVHTATPTISYNGFRNFIVELAMALVKALCLKELPLLYGTKFPIPFFDYSSDIADILIPFYYY